MSASPYIVIDASVAGAWSFNEPRSNDARLVLAALLANRVTALAPDRFLEEALRICQKKMAESAGVISAENAWDRFVDIATLPIYLIPAVEIHEFAWRYSITANITTHDALYLAAAARWDAELWTLDKPFAARAKAAGHRNVYDLNNEVFRH